MLFFLETLELSLICLFPVEMTKTIQISVSPFCFKYGFGFFYKVYSFLLIVSCMYKVQTFIHYTKYSMFCIFSQLHQKSLNRAMYQYPTSRINPFQPTVTLHIETSHLIYSVNQVTCFNMKCNTWLRWVIIYFWIMFRIPYQKSCWNIVEHF